MFYQAVSCKFMLFLSPTLGELSGLPLPPWIGLDTVQVWGRQVQKSCFKSTLFWVFPALPPETPFLSLVTSPLHL